MYRNLFYMILLANVTSDLLYLRYERQNWVSSSKQLQERSGVPPARVRQSIQAVKSDKMEQRASVHDASQQRLYDIYYTSTPIRSTTYYNYIQDARQDDFYSNLKDTATTEELKKQKAVLQPRKTAF